MSNKKFAIIDFFILCMNLYVQKQYFLYFLTQLLFCVCVCVYIYIYIYIELSENIGGHFLFCLFVHYDTINNVTATNVLFYILCIVFYITPVFWCYYLTMFKMLILPFLYPQT